ncbi:DUF2642 domain-containing protein [Priestia megaterium]|uniref:DUF2642 domain-containing protein n=1 Tax=Priestia megaterium TaxID=1404 RepID=UPI0026E2590D|nr:DUF2642 domain-containing protein [Priestia megaterium]MDO6851844.1 DUF2642 domain-containing protein [Priestia megaterium]
MSNVTTLLGKQIEVQISGKDFFEGILIDFGQDILVLFNGQQFLYIPLLHIHSIKLSDKKNQIIDSPTEQSFTEEIESISYRKVLINAKGMFIEIYATGNISFHGYILNVLNDYLAFYSPVYKIIFIPLNHLKWFAPYNHNVTPYTLDNKALPVKPSNISFSRTLEEQLKKLEGELVVFDVGKDPMKVGLLKEIENNLIELVIANGETVFLKQNHIKSVHLPQ